METAILRMRIIRPCFLGATSRMRRNEQENCRARGHTMTAKACAPSELRLPPGLAGEVRRAARGDAQALILAGLKRTADYQDKDYASLYWRRLLPFVNLASTGGADECELLAAATHQLALGMTYPDLIRLAELRLRACRAERDQAKLDARETEVSTVGESIHPSIEEIADAMPFGLGRRLFSSAIGTALVQKLRQRAARRASLSGWVLLRFVASLKPWRRSSLRFARETESLEEWLDTVWAAAKRDLKLAVSLAQARSLLHGYGEVYARGVKQFDIICEYVRNNKFSVPAESVNALVVAAQAVVETEPLERAVAAMRTGARQGNHSTAGAIRASA